MWRDDIFVIPQRCKKLFLKQASYQYRPMTGNALTENLTMLCLTQKSKLIYSNQQFCYFYEKSIKHLETISHITFTLTSNIKIVPQKSPKTILSIIHTTSTLDLPKPFKFNFPPATSIMWLYLLKDEPTWGGSFESILLFYRWAAPLYSMGDWIYSMYYFCMFRI